MPSDIVVEHPLPERAGFCAILHGFLDRDACATLVREAERRGFQSAETDYPPTYRNNARQVHDDAVLAETLLERARPWLPAELERGSASLTAVNPRFRLCRYVAGQRFGIHQDGVRHEGAHTRSMLTFMVYLTDASDIEGGDTVFYAGPARTTHAPAEIGRVRPRLGSLIVFEHTLWHAGETVTRGVKHVLRSDLLYTRLRCDTASPAHRGYVFALERLVDGRIASGGRDGAIRIEGASFGAHAQSVLGLASLDEKRLVSVSRERHVNVWDLETGRVMHRARAHEGAALCVTRVDAESFATGGADHDVVVFDEAAHPRARLQGHRGWVWSLAMLSPGVLASASEDGVIALWDLETRAMRTKAALGTPLRSVSIAGARIAVGAHDGTVTLLSYHEGALVVERTFRAHDAQVRRVRFIEDGRLVTAGEDDHVRVWTGGDATLLGSIRRTAFVTDVLEVTPGVFRVAGYDGSVEDVPLNPADVGAPRSAARASCSPDGAPVFGSAA